jgi:hypothetical protein
MPSGIVPVSDVDRARLRRVPRSRLSELRHAAQWPLRHLYYADARGAPRTSGSSQRPGRSSRRRRSA